MDLKVLYATSGLAKDFRPLPSNNLIDREIGRQKRRLDGGELQNTEMFIVGRGTDVQVGNLAYAAQTNERITAQQGADRPIRFARPSGAVAVTPSPTPVPTATPTPTPTPVPSPSKYGPLPIMAGNDATDSTTYDLDATNVQFLASGGNVTAGTGTGGDGGRIALTSGGVLQLESSTLDAATGSSGGETFDGGTGGQVTISSTAAAASETPAVYLMGDRIVVGNDADSNETAATARGGAILVTSARTGGIGISVGGSTKLETGSGALSPDTGGNVTLQTNGANIQVDSFRLVASGAGSQVLLTTANAAQSSLTDATFSADVLKIQALGPNGTITIGGQSALTGNSQLLQQKLKRSRTWS